MVSKCTFLMYSNIITFLFLLKGKNLAPYWSLNALYLIIPEVLMKQVKDERTRHLGGNNTYRGYCRRNQTIPGIPKPFKHVTRAETDGQPSVKQGLAERDSRNYRVEQNSGRARISAEVALKVNGQQIRHCAVELR